MICEMVRERIVTLLLTVILALGATSYCQEGVKLGSILDPMHRGHLSGSLEYWGCSDEGGYVTRKFPLITTPTNPSAPPLQVLREIFANDNDIQVTQEPDGTIRMIEKTVPQDLLNVKIAHISFDDEQKKNPSSMYFHISVMDFITKTPEVKAFMKDHNISFSPKMINQAMSPHPSFSGELNNVTLSQALDYMLKTFRGLWIYKECSLGPSKGRTVDFSFTAPNDSVNTVAHRNFNEASLRRSHSTWRCVRSRRKCTTRPPVRNSQLHTID